jgi:uncharacterized membrane protein YqjE
MAEQSAGLMESLKRLVSTLASIVSTRLELLANELQEERLRLTQMLVFALIALFCFGMSILLLTGFIVVLFWDDHRVAALGGLGALFLALGMLMAILLRNKVHARPKLFSASMAELAKDREHLDTHHE